jgi:hypothetical protein
LWRGHGAMYDALNHGQVAPERIRRTLASVPLPRAADGRIMLAVDVCPARTATRLPQPQASTLLRRRKDPQPRPHRQRRPTARGLKIKLRTASGTRVCRPGNRRPTRVVGRAT